ncbi:MAG: precorrin-2 C(20)-methyltransferase [Cyanobacteria bacterium P01_A01_bin.84]
MTIGTLYGISVGPGDPELITIKGLKLLQKSPVVAFPSGVNGKPGMAQQIISQWLDSQQIQLSLEFPYVRDIEILQAAWESAARQVWQYLETGKNVVFACEGDISFFSTFTYLSQTLQKIYPQVQIELIPGVCSPMAAASLLKLPLTIRKEKLVILPAVYSVSELETALDFADVVVLMKINSVYKQVWQVLQQRNLLHKSQVLEKVSLPDMRIYSDLSDRFDLQLPYFSLLIVQVRPRDYENS